MRDRSDVPDADNHQTGSLKCPNRRLATAARSLDIDVDLTQSLSRALAGGILGGDLGSVQLFVAGEMLDWDAPTGGYLLQASFATGLAAARGIEDWINAAAR